MQWVGKIQEKTQYIFVDKYNVQSYVDKNAQIWKLPFLVMLQGFKAGRPFTTDVTWECFNGACLDICVFVVAVWTLAEMEQPETY